MAGWASSLMVTQLLAAAKASYVFPAGIVGEYAEADHRSTVTLASRFPPCEVLDFGLGLVTALPKRAESNGSGARAES